MALGSKRARHSSSDNARCRSRRHSQSNRGNVACSPSSHDQCSPSHQPCCLTHEHNAEHRDKSTTLTLRSRSGYPWSFPLDRHTSSEQSRHRQPRYSCDPDRIHGQFRTHKYNRHRPCRDRRARGSSNVPWPRRPCCSRHLLCRGRNRRLAARSQPHPIRHSRSSRNRSASARRSSGATRFSILARPGTHRARTSSPSPSPSPSR